MPAEVVEFRDAIRQIVVERVAPRAAEIDEQAAYPWDLRQLFAEHAPGVSVVNVGDPYGRRLAAELGEGDSIAVNGVCLTACDVQGESFGADAMSYASNVKTEVNDEFEIVSPTFGEALSTVRVNV